MARFVAVFAGVFSAGYPFRGDFAAIYRRQFFLSCKFLSQTATAGNDARLRAFPRQAGPQAGAPRRVLPHGSRTALRTRSFPPILASIQRLSTGENIRAAARGGNACGQRSCGDGIACALPKPVLSGK
jgi:hypothetical protein